MTTGEFNFKDFIAHKDFYELEEIKDTIQQEIDFRKDENYKDHVKGVLTAIQDLIDNGFGNKLATVSCYTWEELFAQILQDYH